MSTSFPGAVDSFPTEVVGQTITAPMFNNPQDSIVAIQQLLVGPAFINVKGYGAKGDGSTDDTTPLNNALTALAASPGGTLIIPPGSYKTTASLTFTAQANSAYTIWGTGYSRILATQSDPGAEGGALTLNGLSTARLTIRGLRIERSPAGTTTGTLDGILCQPITGGTANFAGLTLQDVTSLGFTLWGISIVNASNVQVLNCTCTSHKNGGLEFVGGADVTVLGGDFSSNVSSTGGSDYGIAFASSATYGATDGFLVHGVQANSNGRKGIDVHHGKNGVISGNKCVGNGSNGSATTAAGIYAVNEDSTKAAQDITIVDNHVDMTGNNVNGAHGIEVGAFGSSAVESGTFLVARNTIRGCDAHASDGSVFIYNPSAGTAVARIVVSKNTMEHAAGTGASAILTQNNTVNTHEIEIEGNLIHCNGAVTGGVTAQSSDKLSIVGNMIQFDSTSTNGIFASTGQATVTGNHLFGTASTTSYNTASCASAIVNGNYIGTAANLAPIVGATQNALKAVVSSSSVTITSGTREGSTTGITFGYTFTAAPQIIAMVQNLGTTASAERPVVAEANNVSTTGFDLFADAIANVAANRVLTISWVAIGT